MKRYRNVAVMKDFDVSTMVTATTKADEKGELLIHGEVVEFLKELKCGIVTSEGTIQQDHKILWEVVHKINAVIGGV